MKQATVKDLLNSLEYKEYLNKIENREQQQVCDLEVYYLDYIGEVFLANKHEIPNDMSLSVYALDVLFKRAKILNLTIF